MTLHAAPDRQWSPRSDEDVARLSYSAATEVGPVRSVNEDAVLAAPPVFVVADGMGGYERGDLASTIVIEEFAALQGRERVDPDDLEVCIARARTRVRGLATGTSSPGSTVLAAAYLEQSGRGYWAIAHEGDSRAYQWRGGKLSRITKDHSVVQELVDEGRITIEEAQTHAERHIITRALGDWDSAGPDFSLVPVEEGSRLLLCSDGLTGELSDSSIGRILAEQPGSAAATDLLVRRALEAGGHDNISVVLVDALSVGGRAVEDTLDPVAVTDLDVAELVEDTIPSGRRSR